MKIQGHSLQRSLEDGLICWTLPLLLLHCSCFSVGILFTNVTRRKLQFLNLDPKRSPLSPRAPKQEALASLLALDIGVACTFVPVQRHFSKPTRGLQRLFMAADCCSQQDYEKQAGIYRTVMMENIGGNAEPQACQNPGVHGVRRKGC